MQNFQKMVESTCKAPRGVYLSNPLYLNQWLVLPYEMVGLSEQEIIDNKPGLGAIMASINTHQ